ncbi:MAG: hypothetical protein J07HQX50_00054, partial [Haloquadratum sp. J07HQX50]
MMNVLFRTVSFDNLASVDSLWIQRRSLSIEKSHTLCFQGKGLASRI